MKAVIAIDSLLWKKLFFAICLFFGRATIKTMQFAENRMTQMVIMPKGK